MKRLLPLILLLTLATACGMPASTDDVPDASGADVQNIEDAQVADGQADAGNSSNADAADVQTGDAPTDAGAMTYDLNAPRAALEVHVLYMGACTGTGCEALERTEARMPSCSVQNNLLRFSVRACFMGGSLCDELVGTLPFDGGTGTGSLAIDMRLLNVPSQAMAIVRHGTAASMRQGFHVQMSAPSERAVNGIDGVPGRTTSPMHGDLWLLGCQVMP